MAQQECYAFCDGPHNGPCPNRMVRLLNEIREKALISGGIAEDVFRQIIDAGRGGEDLRCDGIKGGGCSFGADKPSFNEETGEFSARNRHLHTFGDRAPNLVAVLSAFKKQDWARVIFNPLHYGADTGALKRLQDAALALNHAQKPRQLIVFSTYVFGGKIWIRWDFLPDLG